MKKSILAISLILVGMTACQLKGKDVPENGVSKQLAQFRSTVISELSYDLHLKIPAEKERPIRGQAALSFRLKEKRQALFLDFKAAPDQLHLLVVNGDTILNPLIEKEHIRLPKKALLSGSNQVVIDFEAGDGALNRNENYFYALFVPDRARTAIPCFDQPDLKGRFAVTMEVPESWSGVANGRQVLTQLYDGYKTIEFEASEPLSTYLWAFAAGAFQYSSTRWKDLEIGLYHMESDSAKYQRNEATIFKQVTESLDWLENYTQIKYPFQTYNLVAIPSFQFGGMEHPGATYYRANKLFLDENPTREEELSRANLIAHETAHMWFGDLVTMPWFEEVWLKEVFANYMADKITQPWFPEMDHQLRFLLAHFPAAYSVDRTSGANPIGQQLDNLENAGTLYGAIIYHKSPIVMNQLEHLAGSAQLQQGIQDYLNDFAYGNASWNDLIERVDRYAEDDLTVWSQAWVFEPGRPVIAFSPSTQQEGKWRIRQQPEHVTEANSHVYWPQIINLLHDTTQYRYDLFDAAITVDENLEAYNTLFMADDKGYGLVRMTTPQIDYWLAHAQDLQRPLLRGRLCINLYENLLDGNVHPEAFIAYLVRMIENDGDPLLTGLYTRYLNTAYWQLLPEAMRDQHATALPQQLWHLMASEPNKATKKTLFRAWANLVQSPAGLNQLASICMAETTLDGIGISEQDKISLLCELAVKEYAHTDSLIRHISSTLKDDNNQQMLAFIAPALSSNAAGRDAFFLSLAQPENRQKESWVGTALQQLHHPLRQATSILYLPKTLEMLEEIQMTGDIFFPIGWLSSSFGSYSSEEAYQLAERFLNEHPDYPPHLKLKILQNIDGIQRGVAVKKKYYQ